MKKAIFSFAAFTTVLAATSFTASAEEVVVKKGDTLWGIAQNNGVSVSHIKEINDLTSNLIFPEQRLEVLEEQTYTVKAGDTLWGISEEYGLTVADLMVANALDSDLILPGQVLKLTDAAKAPAAPAPQQEAEVEAQAVTAASQPAEEASTSNDTSQDVVKTITVEATAYTANCEGCSGITYTGINLIANPDRKVIAVDPDVIPLGTEVYVEGYGRAVAGDIGGAIDGNRIDVFIPDRSEALEFGRQTVQVKILG